MNNQESTLKPGSTLYHGAYRIERTVGRGGFGITYLAINTQLDTKVAIKEFFPKGLLNRDHETSHASIASKETTDLAERLKAKFVKEARRIARLSHPSIVRVTGAFEENGTAYYVMDYVDGTDLQSLVRRGGALKVKQAVGFINQIGAALEYLHSMHINHLDVKPANILFDPESGKTVLIDFGLSKQYDNQGNQTSTTPVGISEGYAPLEQYEQGGVQEFSATTDIYALGGTLFFLLTGQRPPSAQSLVENELQFPNQVPEYLRKAIRRAMAPRRADRYKTIGDFLKDVNIPISEAIKIDDEEDEDTIITDHEVTVIGTPYTEKSLKSKVTKATGTAKETTARKKKFLITVCTLAGLAVLLTGLSFSRQVLFYTATSLKFGCLDYSHTFFSILIALVFTALACTILVYKPQKHSIKTLIGILAIGALASAGATSFKLHTSFQDDTHTYSDYKDIWYNSFGEGYRLYNRWGKILWQAIMNQVPIG